MTNNLKSLEAQSEKVRASCGIEVTHKCGNDWARKKKYVHGFLLITPLILASCVARNGRLCRKNAAG